MQRSNLVVFQLPVMVRKDANNSDWHLMGAQAKKIGELANILRPPAPRQWASEHRCSSLMHAGRIRALAAASWVIAIGSRSSQDSEE